MNDDRLTYLTLPRAV